MDTLSALGVPVRRNIIELLAKRGRLSVTEISKQFDITSSAISQHLGVLREARLVNVTRQAQLRMYGINPEALTDIEAWAKTTRQIWETKLDYLDTLIQAEKQHDSK
ncbi:MAG TPA: metalloregulator ArsR/SmtB family transcription factor [Candidatus Saccharimonadales bacterium]|nr:metalloregulator ArsR/SmtB family transcription factor [Candidatus Saccharimonadales bacterium]